ncbi:MAG: ABC transporter ATP-binding protein [Candidatus Dormibacteraceae bacterium]
MPPAAQLIDATKKYGDLEAVKGISLDIALGEVVAMLGPNGAGKTTSISLMLGLRKATSGTARLFGMEPTDRRARSRTGVMLQESGVPQVLKVSETIDLFRSYYPKPMPTARVIQLAGLEEKARSQNKDLSGGQRQRLYFALAICGDPDLIFLDEPTVGLDVESRRAFIQSIKGFIASGKTIVLTTHYLEEADELARRVVVIDHGKVIADASPEEIKDKVVGKKVTFKSVRALGPADLENLPVTATEVNGQHFTLVTGEPEAVLRELFRRGVDFTDLEVTGAGLEEAFLALTERADK